MLILYRLKHWVVAALLAFLLCMSGRLFNMKTNLVRPNSYLGNGKLSMLLVLLRPVMLLQPACNHKVENPAQLN